jgi:hypothetical protein
MTDFDEFWQAYPRKVAKAAARREFEKAIRKTTLECILSGVEAYRRNKPDYQDWCHPRTWLHQERWDDEWESEKEMTPDQIEYWWDKMAEDPDLVPDSIKKLLPPTLRLVGKPF